jgi:hypothetical protein
LVTGGLANAGTAVEARDTDFVIAADAGVAHGAFKVVAERDAATSSSSVGADFAGSALSVAAHRRIKVSTDRGIGEACAAAGGCRQTGIVSQAGPNVALGCLEIAALRRLFAVTSVTVWHTDLVGLRAVTSAAQAALELSARRLDAAAVTAADRTGRAMCVQLTGRAVSADRFTASVVVADGAAGTVSETGT